jgi:hypothetical protein
VSLTARELRESVYEATVGVRWLERVYTGYVNERNGDEIEALITSMNNNISNNNSNT